jgi:tRNA A37 threonylcarbamoyladenosine synthetase subunit TsaC/SUA5/YrdC
LAYHGQNVKIVPMAEALARVADLTKALRDGALVCIPIGGTYRLVADLRSDAAVTRLMQSKRRAKSHPAWSSCRRSPPPRAWSTAPAGP